MDQQQFELYKTLVGTLGIGTVLAAIVANVVTYRVASWKFRQELEIDSDKNLRDHRITSYKKLWGLLKPLAKYPEPGLLNQSSIRQLAVALREWYFDDGGLFLSESAREDYFNLQDALKIVLQKQQGTWPSDMDEPINVIYLREYLERNAKWSPPKELVALAASRLDGSVNVVPNAIIDDLRRLASTLRTTLTQDVLTRRSLTLQPVNGMNRLQ
jgi:hypothetical protein